MEALVHIAVAMALIAVMIGLRMASSRAVFQFRMNNGFRAHDCDGSCSRHGKDAYSGTEDSKNI